MTQNIQNSSVIPNLLISDNKHTPEKVIGYRWHRPVIYLRIKRRNNTEVMKARIRLKIPDNLSGLNKIIY